MGHGNSAAPEKTVNLTEVFFVELPALQPRPRIRAYVGDCHEAYLDCLPCSKKNISVSNLTLCDNVLVELLELPDSYD